MIRCARCGREEPGDEPPLTWTSARERGEPVWFCAACSRENLRSIEAKLDSDWW